MKYVRAFGIWVKILLAELANNIISVIVVALLYFMLWHFPQTLDLLVVLNQNDATNLLQLFALEVPLYFALLLILAFFIWNAPKYYYKANYTQVKFKNVIGFVPTKHYDSILLDSKHYSYNCKHHIRRVLPRVLGCLLLFISAFAILNVIELYGIENLAIDWINPFKSLVVVTLLLLLLLEYHIYNFIRNTVRKIPKSDYLIIGVLIALLGFIFVLGAVNSQTEKDLQLLFSSNFALAIIFLVISFNTKELLKVKYKPVFYGGIIVAGLLVVILYIYFNFNPYATKLLNPLSVILICLTALYTLSFILVFAGKKMRFPLFTTVFIIAIVFGEINANRTGFDHYVLEETKTNYTRPPLEKYLYNWLVSREDKIKQAKTEYPVLLISAEGGGSRAGLWSLLVHSYLSEISNNKYYTDHLLSITGASGGNVGNAMFLATAQTAHNTNKNVSYQLDAQDEVNEDSPYRLKYKASKIYAGNYLSTSIVGLLGRDLIQNIIGFLSFDNRGKLLQQEWQKRHRATFNQGEVLHKDILSFYSSAKDSTDFIPPLLFMNSAHTQSGKYNVISPVDFKNSPNFCGYLNFYQALNSKQLKDKDSKRILSLPRKSKRSIQLVEAMRINAAFPYITPTGEIKELGQFGDAGYYDNIGGTVTINIKETFQRVLALKRFEAIRDKICLKSVLIYSELDTALKNVYKPVSQLNTPMHTLLQVRSGHTQEMIDRLGDYRIGLRKTTIDLNRKADNVVKKAVREANNNTDGKITPILPLGRYLSKTAIYSMEQCLEKNYSEYLKELISYEKSKQLDN
ncbi:hypothetical protein [Pseudofulvibacter geojedonensis]|uniref:PNPLA domain-containing protein n=1 Tax=Pseudofulvibacter geojedonensis TaxID=1123758 RepID=A0ABW3HZE8_9FLAO